MKNIYTVVADIGGTNTRFGLCENGRLISGSLQYYGTQDTAYESFTDVLKQYLDTTQKPVSQLILATPGYIRSNGTVHAVNLPKSWCMDKNVLEAECIKNFPSIQSIQMINDFEAQALGVLGLDEDKYVHIGSQELIKNANKLVIGPGTGLGVCALTYRNGEWITFPTEAGHVYPSFDEDKKSLRAAIIRRIKKNLAKERKEDEKPVTIEQMLSGPGLRNIYIALKQINKQPVDKNITSEDILKKLHKNDVEARETVGLFIRELGSVTGNMALSYRPEGGIYFVGNIMSEPKISKSFSAYGFRERMESNKEMAAILKDFPIYCVLQKDLAFLGLERLAMQRYERVRAFEENSVTLTRNVYHNVTSR